VHSASDSDSGSSYIGSDAPESHSPVCRWRTSEFHDRECTRFFDCPSHVVERAPPDHEGGPSEPLQRTLAAPSRRGDDEEEITDSSESGGDSARSSQEEERDERSAVASEHVHADDVTSSFAAAERDTEPTPRFDGQLFADRPVLPPPMAGSSSTPQAFPVISGFHDTRSTAPQRDPTATAGSLAMPMRRLSVLDTPSHSPGPASRTPPARQTTRSPSEPANLSVVPGRSPATIRRQSASTMASQQAEQSGTGADRAVPEIILPRWQPDAEVTYCPICHTQFSIFVRKHHCR